MAVRLPALSAGRLLAQEDSCYSFLLKAESNPRAMVAAGGIRSRETNIYII
jgi:hypothetical protein